jgi:hypothetical protein
MDLFTPIIAHDKLHPNFVATMKNNAAGVREVLAGWAVWPAPGSEDTELGVLMELEVGHG